MFDTIWAALQKDIHDSNTMWDKAMDKRAEMEELMITSGDKLVMIVKTLDSVLKQCTGKNGKFTPITKDGKITGFTVVYESGGLTVTKTLDVSDTAPNIPADQQSQGVK